MINDTRTRREQSVTKSGLIPRPVIETDPTYPHETAPTPSRKEAFGEAASNSLLSVVLEGRDAAAVRDDDNGEDSS